MMKQTNLIFKRVQIKIEGNTIRCENHTVQMENISRLWTGKRGERELPLTVMIIIVLVNMIGIRFFNEFFTVLTAVGSIAVLAWSYVVQGKDGLHLKLCSGDVYSFIPDNKFFLDQVYSLLNEIIVNKKNSADYSIMFDGNGEIVDHIAMRQEEARLREERAKEEKIKAEKIKAEESEEEKLKASYGVNDQLILQLQTLYHAYSEKENADPEIISLIGQTTEKVKTNDLADIKELYGKFIESGLINECNDLGLNVLISEIKNGIFV